MKSVLSFLLLAAAMTAAAADVTGKWSGTITPEGEGNPASAVMILKQTGTKITGTAGPDEARQFTIENGKMDGAKLTVEARDPNGNLFKIALAVEGDQAKGTVERTRGDGTRQNARIEVTRAK